LGGEAASAFGDAFLLDKRRVANLIIASLEGALMIGRLERSDQALRDAVAHLHAYIETELRNQKRK
jgi:hypothetical protein